MTHRLGDETGKTKLTPTQIRVLRGVRDYDDWGHFAYGMSERGGAATSVESLVRRGLLAREPNMSYTITDEGRAALEATGWR